MRVNSKWISLLVLLGLFCSSIAQAQKKYEFRGAWLQTIFQPDYSEKDPEELKQVFIDKLNSLQELGFNAILFQVRPEADAWYRSDIEPWSRFMTGKQGLAPRDEFDPMAFLIQACHERNMEFHAWLNPYRAGFSGTDNLCSGHIYFKHPEWFVFYNKQLLFDPGVPECRAYINQIVEDIVARYDVDAIHMDDYFYPYPVAGKDFPDSASFAEYGRSRGYTEATKGDWRRENVNQLIKELNRTIKLQKPWVRFGISPFGIYRNKSVNFVEGSLTKGLQNYDDLYADVCLWDKRGWIDYVIPQLYWEIGHPVADYQKLIGWWSQHIVNSQLYIGQDVARTIDANQLSKKLDLVRFTPHIAGCCYWPANEVLCNRKGIADSLANNYYRYKALVPPYNHLSLVRPEAIRRLKVKKIGGDVILTWLAKQSGNKEKDAHLFVVYKFRKGEKYNIYNPAKIVATTKYTSLKLRVGSNDTKYVYVVTAVNRFNHESKPKKVTVKL